MRSLPVLALILVLGLAAPALAEETAVDWQTAPFAQLLERAQAENKPILIDWFTDWCGPCKVLDREVWADEAVGKQVDADFIAVKIDCEKGEGIELSKTYKIFNYPTVMVVAPDGTELDRTVGYIYEAHADSPDRPIGYYDKKDMVGWMGDMAAGRNTPDDLMASTPLSSTDTAQLLLVGKKLADQSRADDAQPYLERVVELDPDNARGYKLTTLLVQADLQRKLLEYGKAIDICEQVIAEDSTDEYTDEALGNIAYYQNKLGDNEGSLRTHHRKIARHPDDPGTLNAFAWFCATRGLDLENATDAAKKAVELTQEDPGYLDTLAECYYAREMYDEAIATIDKAIAKDADAYFQKQRAKFVAASTGS